MGLAETSQLIAAGGRSRRPEIQQEETALERAKIAQRCRKGQAERNPRLSRARLARFRPMTAELLPTRGDRPVEPMTAEKSRTAWPGSPREPSSISMRRLIGKPSNVCVRPLGHRTVAWTAPSFFPRPKKSSLVCCDKNPEPAWRYFVWRRVPASTVTAAPIASRLLLCPRKRKAIELPMPSIARRKIRICGAFRFLSTISSLPSPSKSASANARLSSRKSNPTTPETSENVPSRLFAKKTFLS